MTQQITLIKDKILSDNYFTLHNITYDLTRKDGEVIRHKREVYDRGNGATILLYNAKKKTVVLIRQFRVATWVNGNESGQLIETCAGCWITTNRKCAFVKKRLKRRAMKWAKCANYLNCICRQAV